LFQKIKLMFDESNEKKFEKLRKVKQMRNKKRLTLNQFTYISTFDKIGNN